MKITYGITVCNEFIEIQRLLTMLLEKKRPQDEIVVLVDLSKNEPTSELLGYLHKLSSRDQIILKEDVFQNHFADWKNKLMSYCTGDYIFQIDADEMIDEYICRILPQVLEMNPTIDVMLVPRINTVEGLTQEHIKKWGWNVNEHGHINFPDYQWRIYRNKSSVSWINKVHEVLTGYKTISHLPADKEWCLLHPKTIERQEKQNTYYNTL